jgi:hypothetical protein
VVLAKTRQKVNKSEEISKTKPKILDSHVHHMQLTGCREAESAPRQSAVFKLLCDLLSDSLPLITLLPKKAR